MCSVSVFCLLCQQKNMGEVGNPESEDQEIQIVTWHYTIEILLYSSVYALFIFWLSIYLNGRSAFNITWVSA